MVAESKKTKTVSNVARLDVKNPIPFEPTGISQPFTFSSTKKGYLAFLAPKDNFFQLLLEAKLLSPTNNSCVNSKTNFCIGNGIYIKDEKENPEFEEFTKKVNKKGESLNKITKSIFDNTFTVGNSFVEIVRGQIGQKKFIRIINRPFLDCRLSEPNDDDICETVFISKKFRRKNAWTLVEDEAVQLPIYYGDEDLKWYEDEQGFEHCIIHVKNTVSGYDYYGMPDNVSSLAWQILEYKTARYNIDLIENNLVIGGVILLDGNLTQPEATKIGQDIIYSHTGDGKYGRWAVVSGTGMSKAKVEQFNTNSEGSFLKMDENVESKIIDSNNWDSALYGQHQTSGIGNGGYAYLSAVFETKQKTVIEPAQKMIIEDFLNPLFEITDHWLGTNFSDLEIGFEKVTPVSFAGEIDVNAVLTKDEGREIIGRPAIDNETGKEYIKTSKDKKDVSNQ